MTTFLLAFAVPVGFAIGGFGILHLIDQLVDEYRDPFTRTRDEIRALPTVEVFDQEAV